jgi:hypothetical protein
MKLIFISLSMIALNLSAQSYVKIVVTTESNFLEIPLKEKIVLKKVTVLKLK